MQDIIDQFGREVAEKAEEILRVNYKVGLVDAMKSNPKEAFRILISAVCDVLDEPAGQKLLFDGLNSTSMIYRKTASCDQIYRYTGNKPLNPLDLVEPLDIESIEKDSVWCENEGCQIRGRPMWCVTDHELRDRRVKELCNFCAHTLVDEPVDRCLSDSPECKSCPNRQMAIMITGG